MSGCFFLKHGVEDAAVKHGVSASSRNWVDWIRPNWGSQRTII